jgi:translation initiation factor 2A
MCQKKQSRCNLQWTADEMICVRHLNMELHFYQNNSFDKYLAKHNSQKVVEYSMVTNKQNGNHYVACYSTGVKGQPSFVKLYQYPKFDGLPVANKSFYKADDVLFKWNQKGIESYLT